MYRPKDDGYITSDTYDGDIDICMSCGRYYGMTQSLIDAWHKSVNYHSGAVMDQLCIKCMDSNSKEIA